MSTGDLPDFESFPHSLQKGREPPTVRCSAPTVSIYDTATAPAAQETSGKRGGKTGGDRGPGHLLHETEKLYPCNLNIQFPKVDPEHCYLGKDLNVGESMRSGIKEVVFEEVRCMGKYFTQQLRLLSHTLMYKCLEILWIIDASNDGTV